MRKILVMIIFLINISYLCGEEETSPTRLTEPLIFTEEKIHEVEISARIPDIGDLTRGMGFLCLPGDEKSIELKTTFPQGSDTISFSKVKNTGRHKYETSKRINTSWTIDGGEILQIIDNKVLWKAPEKPGDYRLRLLLTEEQRWGWDEEFLPEKKYIGQLELLAIVKYPFDPTSASALEGYAIGVYPNENAPTVSSAIAKRREKYRPPKFFIKVSSANEGVFISPHFRLGDFSTPRERGKTRFIALDYSIVIRLEKILATLKNSGAKVAQLKIIRAYVSPLDREELRRKGVQLTEFSRFMYGDAVAFIVDEDNDKKLDDLNNDGKVDVADAEYLATFAEQVEEATRKPGGIGIYSSFKDPYNPDTPYIQVDTRGWLSRWRIEEP